MKRTMLLILFLFYILFVIGCSTIQHSTIPRTMSLTFTDALDREVTVTNATRVGATSGSLAKIWTLSGGTLTAVTSDAFTDSSLELSKDIIDLGSLKEPSLETIISANLDLIFLISSINSHIQLAETLKKSGVICIFIDIETFDDYLSILDFFTDITNRKDLYKENGLDILDSIQQIIKTKKLNTDPKILLLRTSESKITVRDSNTMAGTMLKNLGCINIADSKTSLLTDLSIEEIISQQPDYIFVICMGEFEEGRMQLENMLNSNPIWNSLDAIKNNKLFYLDKELFHLKPNKRWGESYEVLSNYLSGEK
ncbi:MAG: ABC transporter substrate-binding protein [Lachnospiraceae bacterium]